MVTSWWRECLQDLFKFQLRISRILLLKTSLRPIVYIYIAPLRLLSFPSSSSPCFTLTAQSVTELTINSSSELFLTSLLFRAFSCSLFLNPCLPPLEPFLSEVTLAISVRSPFSGHQPLCSARSSIALLSLRGSLPPFLLRIVSSSRLKNTPLKNHGTGRRFYDRKLRWHN